jgi:hypothetical protein
VQALLMMQDDPDQLREAMLADEAGDAPRAESVWDLARNDVPATVELCLRLEADGRWTADEARVALQLQDDPDVLLKALVAERKRRARRSKTKATTRRAR